jgi:hypothetical protein
VQFRQVLLQFVDSHVLQINGLVIDGILAGSSVLAGERDLPHVVGVLPHVVLHEFRPRGQFGLRTVDLSDSPAAVPNIPRPHHPRSIILDLLGDLAEMSVMLHHCHETQVIKSRCPILQTAFDDLTVVGPWCGVCASGVDRIVVVGEAIEVAVVLAVELDETDLLFEGTEIPRIQEEVDGRANFMIV